MSTLFGRDTERATLDRSIARGLAGAGAVVVIRGEPGIGKSALLADALDRCPATVLLADTVPAAGPASRPLADLAVAAVAAGARPDDPTLVLFRPTLRRLLTGRRPVDMPAADGPDALDNELLGPYVAAIGEVILRLVGTLAGPAVLAVEDLHWADPDTLAVIEFLAARIRGHPLAVLLTLRGGESDAVDAFGTRVGRHAWGTVVDVPALDRADSAAMVEAALGNRADDELAARAFAFAEGVPLMVEEYVAWAADSGESATGRTAPRAPASLRASVQDRMGGLPDDAAGLVQGGALLGRRFDVTTAAEAAALDANRIASAVRLVIRRGLVSAGQHDQLEFRHWLIRDAIDELIVPPQRARLARALLSALGTRSAGDPDGTDDVAARLADIAGLPDLAAGHRLAAGRRAVAAGAICVGIELLTAAARPDGEPAVTDQARLELVEAYALAGHADQALAHGAAALRRSSADPLLRNRIRLSMARAAVAAQRWPLAQELLDRCRWADDRPPVWQSLQAVVALGAGQTERAVAQAAAAIGPAEAAGLPGLVCECYEVLGRAARERSLDDALAWFERAVDTAERHHMPLWRARSMHELATVGQLKDLSLDGLFRAREAAVAAGAPGLLSTVDFHIAAIHGVRFEPEPALAAARRCLDEAGRVGVVRQQAWGWILIGQAHACAGRRANASAAADEAQRLAPGDPEIAGLASGTCRGLASLLATDRDRAIEEFRNGVDALRPLRRVPLPPWFLWPLIAATWAPGEMATALAEADDPAIRVNCVADALWRLAAAVRAGRRGDHQAADAHLTAAERRFAGTPGGAGYRHIGLRLAAERAVDDGWGDPGRWLEEAERWAQSRGFDAFAAGCRALARRTDRPVRRRGRGSTPVPSALAAAGVTTREADVLALIANGLTNPQIAARLYVAPRTVKAHVESLLRKTGTTSRSQLAALAVAENLFGSTPDRPDRPAPGSPTT